MRGWLRRRELGSVAAIMVRVFGPGQLVGSRFVRPGRVAVTFEDGTGRVVVEADSGSMVGMLERARLEVLAVAERERAARDRALVRAGRSPERQRVVELEPGDGGG